MTATVSDASEALGQPMETSARVVACHLIACLSRSTAQLNVLAAVVLGRPDRPRVHAAGVQVLS
jgi:hypothetical protein